MFLWRTGRVAALILALLLLTASTWTVCGVAAGPTTTPQQRQRLRSLSKYAERVGAALVLLTNGPNDALGGDEAGDGHVEEGAGLPPSHMPNAPAAPGPVGDASLPILARFMQYPHTAVQAAVKVVSQKVAATRILASVLMNSKLSERSEAQVRTAAAHANGEGDPRAARRRTEDGFSSSSPVPAALRRARAPVAEEETATPEEGGESSMRRVVPLAATSSTRSPFITCLQGYVGLASDTSMYCAGTGWITVGDYMSVPEEDRSTCHVVPRASVTLQQECICAADSFIEKQSNRAFACSSRPADVQVLLDDAYLCHNAADAALGLPSTMESEYCIETTRHAKLNLTVRWKYSYLTLDALKAAVDISDDFATPRETPPGSPDLQWVVLGKTPSDGDTSSDGAPLFAKGNYSELMFDTTLFTFVTPFSPETEEEAGVTAEDAFYVSRLSELYSAQAFTAVYCFATPRKTQEHLIETALESEGQMRRYFGNINGTSTHTLQLDLSSVSDDFVEGNQMYVETGIHDGSIAYSYRVARVHISFSDLAPPSAKTHHYKKQFNPLYILLIVVVGVIVVGAGLAVLWFHLMQDEAYDDSIVSRAQRKKGKTAATAS